jgi:REP element-mobilizing transposase RayT
VALAIRWFSPDKRTIVARDFSPWKNALYSSRPEGASRRRSGLSRTCVPATLPSGFLSPDRAHDRRPWLLPSVGFRPTGRTIVARDFSPWEDGLLFFPPGGRTRDEPLPSAWTQNYYHTLFSTKERIPLITPDIEERLYPFLGGILRDLRCTPVEINGVADHVHLLIRYRPDLSHSEMLQQIKGRSSKWIHETFPQVRHFAWQEGYGGFTVSRSAVPAARKYIADQKRHHQRNDFKTEFLQLLRRHGIEFDEREVFK